MKRRVISLVSLIFLLASSCLTVFVGSGFAWSNGGFSSFAYRPTYGTHDWIAQHALDWLPAEEKFYITSNLAVYLYGTELPDNNQAPDGIGDTAKHHVYFDSTETIIDDSAAVRALAEYVEALSFLKTNDYVNAAKTAGEMSHYIADMAVFGHVMGSHTDWGAEVHHIDYEDYVNERTSTYAAEFDLYLSFDGSLSRITAYDAAKNLAYDTTFHVKGDLTCVWMNQNYDWSNSVFKSRVGESLNLAVNTVADVLHGLSVESKINPPAPLYNIPIGEMAAIVAAVFTVVVIATILMASSMRKSSKRKH